METKHTPGPFPCPQSGRVSVEGESCKVVIVEETRKVPARIETVKKYKLEGHCSPLSDSE